MILSLRLIYVVEYTVKNYVKRVRPLLITAFEICIILHLLQKPNEIIVLLFMQNISAFLSTSLLPLRRLSSKLLPVSRNGFRILTMLNLALRYSSKK